MTQPSRPVPGAPARDQDHALQRSHFARRALTVIVLVTVVVLAVAFAWYAIEVLLVVFTGILLAVFLGGLSDWVSAHTPLSRGWALGAVVLGWLALLGISGYLFAPAVSEQFAQLTEQVPQSATQLQERIAQTRLGRRLLELTPAVEDITPGTEQAFTQATNLFSTAFGALANLVIILFVGLYLAIDPGLYTTGFVRLVPRAKRARAREVLHVLGYTLRRWLIGRFFLMTVIGVLIAFGLWVLDVPLAVTLGIIAAVLTFIPNIGPVLSAIPAVLLGLSAGGLTTAAYVVGLYLVVQTVESYIFSPVVEQRTVSLPPVLVITAQVLLGIGLGALGLLLATPLFAVVLVLVKMLYVEDTLGDQEIEVLGEDEAQQQQQPPQE